jgi:DNA-binding GntR family transcriptional regulator
MNARLSEATISEWANSATLSNQVAAKLARELHGAPRWHPVDSEREIGARLDVSSTTVSRAKRLLADHGVIMKHNKLYYVA